MIRQWRVHDCHSSTAHFGIFIAEATAQAALSLIAQLLAAADQHCVRNLSTGIMPAGCSTVSMAAWGSHARQVQAAGPCTQAQRLWPCTALYRQPANRLQCHLTLAASAPHPNHTQRLHRQCYLLQRHRSLSGLNSSKRTRDHGRSEASQQNLDSGQKDDSASSQLSNPWNILPAAAQAPILTLFGFRQKIVAYLRESLLVAYTTLVENVIWGTAEVLRVDRALRWATPRLEQGLARVTGEHACSPQTSAVYLWYPSAMAHAVHVTL